MTIHFDRNLNIIHEKGRYSYYTARGQEPMLNVPNPLFRIMEEEKKRIRKIEEKMMVTINEIEKQLEVTEKEQTKLKDMINKLKSEANEVMNPKKEKYELELPNWNKYFYCSGSGDVDYNYNNKDVIDEGYFEIGNFFKTHEEAELEVKRRKLMTRFEQFRDKCNGNWKPDFNLAYEKYYIFLDENEIKITYNTIFYSFVKFGYFKNEEDCLKAIEIFGDEIKELF